MAASPVDRMSGKTSPEHERRAGAVRPARGSPPMRTSRPHLTYTLLVLLGINTVNFYDRQVLSAVQEKIKADWSLSDSRLGMLGTAFILLYAVIGLPLGHLAD